MKRGVNFTPPHPRNYLTFSHLRNIYFAIILIMAGFVMPLHGQVAIKTNLLSDALLTPNIGIEIGVGSKSTVGLNYGINAWTFDSNGDHKKFTKHWILMPEYRWWPCMPFVGHFFGIYAFGGQMNFSNVNYPFPGFFFGGENLHSAIKSGRYQGEFGGLALTYGYQLPISQHWSGEASLGIGYGHTRYDHYPCADCGRKIDEGRTNYFGITKLALSVIYLF